jgi:hypothetical protein
MDGARSWGRHILYTIKLPKSPGHEHRIAHCLTHNWEGRLRRRTVVDSLAEGALHDG